MSDHGKGWVWCRCGKPLAFERDLRGGVREFCDACGFSQPLERREAPPVDRVLPRKPARPSDVRDRREYHRAYYHNKRKSA